MQVKKYIYSFNYDRTENELCKLESKYLFNQEEKNKVLFSAIKVDPSSSAFIKKRIDIITFSEDYGALIAQIKNENIVIEGFKIEYIVLAGDNTEYPERPSKLRDIGYSIEGDPDYYHPTTTYGLCFYEGVWYFGIVIKNNLGWHEHKQKPRSYSISLPINLAKSLVNIAAMGNKENKLLDACCGVGTILLEACFAENNIEGCEINSKIFEDARTNLTHFNYSAKVYNADVKDLSTRYDTAIIDLPYNLFCDATESDIEHIIESSAKLSNRLVIVSGADIKIMINKQGFVVTDYCTVKKIGKGSFTRKLWVCDKG